MRAATGTQFELAADTPSGPATAVITEVAAGIRSYAVSGIDLVETFAEQAPPPMGAGIVLVPWPNRIRDGRWNRDGSARQLAITEPARHNAIHGLLRYSPYRETLRTQSMVTLAATVFPQAGYPFQLDTEVSYALVADGLDVTHVIRNVGEGDAPVAIGAHPYLRIGDVPSSELLLRVAAETHIDVDERMLPVGTSSVTRTKYDLRTDRAVHELDLDDGFTGVSMGHGPSGHTHSEHSRSEHTLTAPDGRTVSLWGDENIRYLQVFTPSTFPVRTKTGTVTRQAVAIEPMTAPADAFNSGDGLRWLTPGEEWTVRWGIRHTGIVG
ncbi:aldose 1-epimerase family protein [Glaciibacter superstes]|uniref:aldose 1-epimerase family protein n=1 Tax=Glaciibacter superstes TaxID=501023 RepID=UPI0003B4B56E|nr:aldose 1-epimerase family protein [Glaciibacter superstes]